MKNTLLLLFVFPLIMQSMEKPPVTISSNSASAKQDPKKLADPKKLSFCLHKVKEMAARFSTTRNGLRYVQCNTDADREKLTMHYALTGEVLSEELSTLIRINPLPVIACLKLDETARRNLIYILHNTDPAQNARHAKHHEEFLWSLNQGKHPQDIKRWATEYDKRQLEKGQPQRYGTCLDQNCDIQTPVAGCSPTLQESDALKINARRDAIGLPSIEEQLVDAYQKDTMNKQRDC